MVSIILYSVNITRKSNSFSVYTFSNGIKNFIKIILIITLTRFKAWVFSGNWFKLQVLRINISSFFIVKLNIHFNQTTTINEIILSSLHCLTSLFKNLNYLFHMETSFFYWRTVFTWLQKILFLQYINFNLSHVIRGGYVFY